MASKLTVGVAQVHTQQTREATLSLLKSFAQKAAAKDVSILLFPEAFLGGYPRTCDFGASIGSRAVHGRQQFLSYFKSAIDLGDTTPGATTAWLDRTLPINPDTGRRGDGTREYLEATANATGVFLVVGVVEKAGGSLYCAALYIDPVKGVVGKRRKVQPTGSERLVWSQGQPASLKVVATTIKGVRVVMGCAICWENFMPLLRYAVYAQGVNLWLAPTADQRATWESLMRTVAGEGRCWVLSANQAIKKRDLPEWITDVNKAGAREEAVNGAAQVGRRRTSMSARTEENHEIAWRGKMDKVQESVDGDDEEEFVSRGGSCIVSPMGETVVGPIWDQDEDLLTYEVDFDECEMGKFDLDSVGHYARLDAFKLTVEGLDLTPPP